MGVSDASSDTARAVAVTNLTREVAPLIGREDLIDALDAAVDGHERLVTLVGAGGAGKTHLAAAFAQRSLGAREVWLCDLAGARDVADLVAVVHRTLGLPTGSAASTESCAERIGVALAERAPLLLVLDNLEHLVAHAAETVGRWLRHARDVTILATSRERLRLPGEHVLEVGPLTEDEAIELLLRRARAGDATLRFAESDSDALRAIVRRLDRLPLALEMAAPWLLTLTPVQLAQELRRGIELLALDKPGAPPRHARLDATIRWTWERLSAAEREVLQQIAEVFRDRFSLVTAEHVLAPPPGSPPIVAVLRGLRERSVLQATRGDPHPDAVLFSCYQTVASLCERLAPPLAPEVRGTIAARFVGLARLEADRLWSGELRSAVRWLERHRADLHALVARLGADTPSLTADASLALQRLASRVGPAEQGAELARRALEDARRLGDVVREADALRAHGEIAWREHRLVDAEDAVRRGLEVLEPDGPPTLRGELWLLRAQIARDLRDHARAAAHGERAQAAFERAGDLRRTALTLLVRATGPSMDEADAEARRLLDHAADIAKDLDDVLISAHLESALALWHTNKGLRAAAFAHHRKALAAFTEAGDVGQRLRVMGFLGAALFDAGETVEGRHLMDDALDEARRLGVAGAIATVLDPSVADAAGLERVRDALRVISGPGDYQADGITAGNVGGLLVRRGELAAARRAYDLGVAEVLTRPVPGRPAVFFRAVGAALDLAAGRWDEAERGFATAIAWTESWDGVAGRSAAGLLGLCLELARARRSPALEPTHPDVVRLLQTIEAAARLSPALGLGLNAARLALTSRQGRRPPEPKRLVIGPDGNWFALGDEARVSLARSGPIRGLLRALAHRANEGGPPLGIGELFGAGWPGERVSAGAAANRVHATLARLRSLGLRSAVRHARDGWSLDPSLHVELVGSGPTSRLRS